MSKKQTKKNTATKKTASTKNTEPKSKATATRVTAQKQPGKRGLSDCGSAGWSKLRAAGRDRGISNRACRRRGP